MSWLGKLIGAAIGLYFGGPIGAIAGLLIGHYLYDRDRSPASSAADARSVQQAFFKTTFQVMGYVCKADGRVSAAEIQTAEAVMRHMALNPEQRRRAIEYFNEGKSPGFVLERTLDEFTRACRGRRLLYRMFLEVQIQAAFADGIVDPVEQRTLLNIAQRLGLSQADLSRLETLLRGGAPHGASAQSRQDDLAKAYEVLGVAPNAPDADVKKAYRRLMNQHHPDKLVSKGLPPEMMKMAQERTQEIRAAYDTVQAARKR